MTINVIDVLATITSLTIVFIGLPAQIIKNYQRKTRDGLASSLIVLAATAYVLWTIYAWIKPDYFLIVSQTPGAVLGLVLIGQFIYYRRNKWDPRRKVKQT